MANWSVSLDKPVAVEPPNAVAYVSYASDDGRRINSVRVPYAAETDLLNFLARECARLSALDAGIATGTCMSSRARIRKTWAATARTALASSVRAASEK